MRYYLILCNNKRIFNFFVKSPVRKYGLLFDHSSSGAFASAQMPLLVRKVSNNLSAYFRKMCLAINLSFGFICLRFRVFAEICSKLPLDNSLLTIAYEAIYCISSAKFPNSRANKPKNQVIR